MQKHTNIHVPAAVVLTGLVFSTFVECRKVLEFILGETNNIVMLIFLLKPHQGSKHIHFFCWCSHISWRSREASIWTSSSFISVLLLLCILDISSSIHLDLGFYYKGFEKLNWLLLIAKNFPVAIVIHHDRCLKENKEICARVASRNHSSSTAFKPA